VTSTANKDDATKDCRRRHQHQQGPPKCRA
jgi:hypothetical protein